MKKDAKRNASVREVKYREDARHVKGRKDDRHAKVEKAARGSRKGNNVRDVNSDIGKDLSGTEADAGN
jgi:hypothetical protein